MRQNHLCKQLSLHSAGLIAGWMAIELSLAAAQGSESAADSLASFMAQRGYQKIAVERDVANQFLIKGKLNGVKSFFKVDTGASATAIDVQRATKLRRLGKEKDLRGAFGFVAKEVPLVAIQSMQLDGVLVSNQMACVIDLHMDRQVYTGSRIPQSGPLSKADVILGSDFLAETQAFLDCGAPTLYVRSEKPSPQLSESMDQSFKKSGWVCVPLEMYRGHLLVKGSVNTNETYFILDTGAASTLFDLKQLDAFKFSLRERVAMSEDIGAHHTDLHFTRLSSLKLGDYEQKSFPVGIADLHGFGLQEPHILGLIGPDLLGQARALIDYCSQKLYLMPRTAPTTERR